MKISLPLPKRCGDVSMVYKVKIYPAARQDLSDIVDYLNTLSQEAALKYYDRLTEEILSLREMPERCGVRRYGTDQKDPVWPQGL